MTIRIHVGAHKTASTYLTACISAVEQQLLQRDFMVLTPPIARDDTIQIGRLLSDSPKPGQYRRRARRLLRGFVNDHRELLISEERILGILRSQYFLGKENRVYITADQRLGRLLDILGTTDVTLLLAVRNPATFLSSAFGEQLRQGGTLSFEEFAGGFDPMAMRWSELVERLAATGATRLVCWRYEDLAAIRQSVLGAFIGDDLAGLVPEGHPVRPGMSQPAYDVIVSSSGGKSAEDRKTLVREAMREFPREHGHEALRIFDERTVSDCMTRYEDDCLRISRLPGVEFLRP